MRKIALTFICAAAALMPSCNQSAQTQHIASSQSDSIEAAEGVVICPADTFSYRGYTMLAEVLGGKQPADASFLGGIASTPAFHSHAAELTSNWNEYKIGKVDKIRKWSHDNLSETVDTVFYPFGGPDFNYLASFFPDVRYSLLVGMEKPGKMPLYGSNAQGSDSLFSALRHSVRNNLRASFFITSHMHDDLNCELQGTLPVVMMFMSLHGYEVVTVNPVELTEEGRIAYTEPDKVWAHTLDKKFDRGFEIMYRVPGEKGVRHLNYLSTDLSNNGYVPSGLSAFVGKTFANQTTFLKAASYLLQSQAFSDVRTSILDNSRMVITGLSGLPYRYFEPAQWQVSLYGQWCAPIKDFVNYPQNDLKEAYERCGATPIDFRYDYGRGSCFFVARKK